MSPNRPLTMSLPLGLFSAATLTAPLPDRSEISSDSFTLDGEPLDAPVVPETDGLNDDIYWDDGSP